MVDRIAYFSYSQIPSREANAVHVLRMTGALDAGGLQVWLYALPGEDGADGGELSRRFGVRPGRWRLETIRCEGRGRRIRFGLRAAIHARRQRIRKAVGRCEYSCLFAAMLGLRVVFETHEVKRSRWVNGFVLRRLLRHSNLRGIVAITGQLREDFAKAHGIAPDRIRVLPDGADSVSEASFSNERSFPGFSVGYTGHLYPGKGMEIVLPLARRCPDMNFHVVGGTEEWIDFWKTEARHCPNLTFHGYVSPAEVGGYLTGFDVVLCPNQASVKSVGGTEIGRWTSPLKIFEYMASGKPIVCSNLPVLCEVMKDGVNCLMCSPEEIRSWKAALERLRDDPNLAAAIGSRGLADLLSRYTWNIRAKKIVAILDGDETDIWDGDTASHNFVAEKQIGGEYQ